MPGFREAHPIDFRLLDKDTQNVLYIEDRSDQLLTLEIRNVSSRPIKLTDLSETTLSATDYHFALRFRPGTLSPASLDLANPQRIQLADETAESWEMTPPQKIPDDMNVIYDVIYLKGKAAGLSLAPDPDQREAIVFKNVGADAGQGARGTNVELLCRNLAYRDTPELPIDSIRERHLSVINHRGKQHIPLQVGFVGSNTVLNDGGSPNALKLRFSNTAVYDQTNPDRSSLTFRSDGSSSGSGGESKIILSFDTGASSEEWALGSETEIKAIVMTQPAGWKLKEPVEGKSPQWELTPEFDKIVLPGKNAPAESAANHFDIDITDIITDYPTGHTHLYVRYQNIPGYWDGQKELLIEKQPLVFFNQRVGIGTTRPSVLLHLGDGSKTSVLRIDGEDAKLGFVADKTPNNHKNWIQSGTEWTDGSTADLLFTGIYGKPQHMIIKADGKVGISTTRPKADLHVAGDYYGKGHIYLHAYEGDGRSGTAYLQARDDTPGIDIGLRLRTQKGGNIVEAVHIDTEGNVGIGTMRPSVLLHLGDGSKTSVLRIDGEDAKLGFVADKTPNSHKNWIQSGTEWTDGSTADLLFTGIYGKPQHMIIKADGKVGISTMSPQAHLDVKGIRDTENQISLQLRSGNTSNNYSSNQITFGYDNSAEYRHAIKTRHHSGQIAGNAIDFYVWRPGIDRTEIGTSHVMSLNGGRVGIGTENPTKGKLEVVGSVNQSKRYSFLSHTYFEPAGKTRDVQQNKPYSIWANERIAASEFNAMSDQRIKSVLGRSDSSRDLEILKKVEIVDFKYIDTLEHGNGIYKKVLAQQIEEFLPTAVTSSRDVVPNIYAKARSTLTRNGTLTVNLEQAHGLNKDETVRLIIEGLGSRDVEVKEVVDEKTFTAALEDDAVDKDVFVYGKFVEDFKTLDYNALLTLAISALQEQQSQIEQLKDLVYRKDKENSA